MNNEINEANNMGAPVAPAPVPPVMGGQPTNNMGAPVTPTPVPPVMGAEPTNNVGAPVAPTPVPPVMGAEPANNMGAPVAPTPVPPAMGAEPTNNMGAPITPPPQAPAAGGEVAQSEAPKAKNNSLLIVLIAVILLAGVGAGVYLIMQNNEKESTPTVPVEDNTPVAKTAEEEFLALANEYVSAVDALWTNDSMVCQNATNQEELLKPSALSVTDAYNGNAFYYVFINTKDDSEMKLDVVTDKDVAGWIRIGKADNSYYVALSDGVNYIVDTGTEFGKASTALTIDDVVTTGNGANYQYMDGQIFGSNTDGNGWGIGDYLVLTDDDDTNDGIYMTNGKKDAGWTPFCSNVE